jgi:hypothetical protein
MSAIFENAVDSLRIGMDFFLKEATYSSRKHAILTLFHVIELLLKERLAQTNPILIYKNIDTKITDDAQTVGVREAIVRLENLGLGLPSYEKKTIEDVQRVRNRIEHHRYDHGAEDDAIIASSLKFFIEVVLHRKLDAQIDGETLQEITGRIFDYDERRYLAEYRFREWLRTKWPDLKEEEDAPEEFRGLHDCPECSQDWLVIGWHDKPFCFYCNSTIDAGECENCGRTFLVKDGCDCGAYEIEDDGGHDLDKPANTTQRLPS